MRRILIFLLAAAFILGGCFGLTKSDDEQQDMDDLNPPADFQFNTTRNVEVNLTSFANVQYNDLIQPYANFKLWKNNPETKEAKKILSARTDISGNFTTDISLPTYLDEIYLTSNELVKPLEITPVNNTDGTINASFIYTYPQSKSKDFTPVSGSDNGYVFTLENMDCSAPPLTQITIRVQNNNNKGLSHVAISLPAGVVPPEPDDGDTWVGEECTYYVENPTNNPYYSIKFETLDPDGVKNGQSDIFVYYLPTDVAQAMDEVTIKAKAAWIEGQVTLDVDFTCGTNDSDGDGVPDDEDDYPEDPDKAYNDYTPAEGEYSTIMYEDLWPSTGDYDMNDMVINYQMIGVMNADWEIVEGIIHFNMRASGAGYDLGFAIDFPDYLTFSNLQDDLDLAYIESNGHTIVFFENQRIPELFNVPSGEWINTDPDDPNYIDPIVWTVTVDITADKNAKIVPPWETPPFNPFIFVNENRSHEIHLPDYPPTVQMDTSLFGTVNDASIPAQGIYFKTSNNLPWVINIAEAIDYPEERIQIINAFHHFADWVNSGGTQFEDWYMDKPGYRDNSLIYSPPN